ncbi:hypothetical protein BH23GEM11_BH23GEM11_08960 [soil metagenome]
MGRGHRDDRSRMPYDWPAGAQYALALGLVAFSLAGRWLLGGVVGGGLPLSLTLGALLLLVLLVRPGPFLAAAVLGWFGAIFMFVAPTMSFGLAGPGETVVASIYTLVLALAVLTAWVSSRESDARERERQAVRESERLLEERSNQLELLVDRAPMGIYLVDADLRILRVNPLAQPVFDRAGGDVTGRDLGEILRLLWHEDSAREVLRLFRNTLETGESVEVKEMAVPRADLEGEIHYDWRIDRITFPGDRPGVVCYFRDVSEQTEAKREIVRSEARYRTLFDSIDQGFGVVEMIFDRDGQAVDYRFLELNPAFERQTGLVDAIGRTARELLPGLEPKWYRIYGDVARTGEPARFVEHSAVMGRWFDVEAFQVGDPETNRVAMLFEDITERRQTERALREEERRMRLVTDAAPALISFVDADLHFQFVNRGYMEWFDREREDFLGRHMREVLGDEAFERVRPRAEAALAGELVEFEAEVPYLDGGTRFVNAHYVPEVGEDGRIGGFYALVHDVTASRRAEEDLRDADRRKDEFLATLAHELRNPMAAIRSALEVMGIVETDLGRTRAMREIIDRQSNQLVRLIDDLLDVSRISAGKIELRRSRVDVREIIQHLVADSGPLCETDGLEMTMDLPAEPVWVDADAARLSQVLNNLLRNACKFTERGGRVRLALAQEGDEARVRVIDTGVGLSPDQLSQIFDMFGQVDGPLTRKGGGLGIGLSLARAVIELHGGSIEASSPGLGLGSEFLVRLRAEDQLAPGGGGVDTRESLYPSGSSSLVIVAADDNIDALEAAVLILRMKGHEVETATNGMEALEKIRSLRPDVALLDIGMPELNGYEVARRIRQEPWGNQVLVVAITGWGADRDKALAREAGFDAHLTKPVDMDQLDRLMAERREAMSGTRPATDRDAGTGRNSGVPPE